MIRFSDLSEESEMDVLRAFVQQEGLDVKDRSKAGLYSKICERYKSSTDDAQSAKSTPEKPTATKAEREGAPPTPPTPSQLVAS
jgi:hypothetical protein